MELKMMVCERCGISGDKARLFDAIYFGEMVLLCLRCSVIENTPIIKKPNTVQLKDVEKSAKVYDRMKVLIGKPSLKEDTFFIGDKLKEIEEHPELELPEENQLNLIDNFHWEIMKVRRRKGMSQKQLGESIGESEIVVEMIEKGKLPENSESVIRKIEQIFQVNLRKITEFDRMPRKKTSPLLLDEEGNLLDKIPEPEIEIIEEKEIGLKENIEIEDKEQELKDFDIKKANISKVTVGDLKKIHRKRIEVTKVEEINEQRKIEERRKILQVLREKERLETERKKQEEYYKAYKVRLDKKRQKMIDENEDKPIKKDDELDKYLGGTELLE